MLAIAYLVGRQIYLTNLKKSIKSQFNSEILIICLLVFGVIGAKLMFIIKNSDKASITDSASFISGVGFSSQGALLGAVIVIIAFAKHYQVKLHLLLDSAAPAAILAYAIARFGCFLSGDDCWGVETNLPWAMSHHGVDQKNHDLHLHPVPLYEIIYAIGIWLYLNYLNHKSNKPYYVFFSLLLLWGLCRFLVEFVSANPPKVLGMSGSQFGSLIMFCSGLGFFIWQYFNTGRHKKKPR